LSFQGGVEYFIYLGGTCKGEYYTNATKEWIEITLGSSSSDTMRMTKGVIYSIYYPGGGGILYFENKYLIDSASGIVTEKPFAMSGQLQVRTTDIAFLSNPAYV